VAAVDEVEVLDFVAVDVQHFEVVHLGQGERRQLAAFDEQGAQVVEGVEQVQVQVQRRTVQHSNLVCVAEVRDEVDALYFTFVDDDRLELDALGDVGRFEE